MFIILVVLTAVCLGVAFYLGWLYFTTRPKGGNPTVSLSMDFNKMESDKDKVVDSIKSGTTNSAG